MKSGKIRVGKNVLRAAVVFILLGGSIACSLYMKYAGQERKTVLFSTDIAIDGDFDDYFDLVVMKSMEGVDLKIIVDGNDSAQKQSGQDAVRNLEKITGGGYGASLVITGRDHNLESPDDSDAVGELVRILENTKGTMDIVTVGSLRDVAALYNRCSDLFEEKVEKLWIFAGDAQGTMLETNVFLDETAFLRVMNSGKADIYWIPCFQSGIWTTGPNTSYFTVRHEEVFRNANPDLLAWFLYRYEKSGVDFQDFISQEHDTGAFMPETRNLWCSSILPLVDGSMEHYWKKYCGSHDCGEAFPFGFTEKKVSFREGGKVEWGRGNVVHVFEVYDFDAYVAFSKFILEEIFREFQSKGG